MLNFVLENEDKNSKARAGYFVTDHGTIQTPIFMVVGTQGTVKAVTKHYLENDIKAQIILGNTYHLYLRPGTEIIEQAGGLHKFINWQKPILTDSGGFQIFSLSDLRKIKSDGVEFKSHIDGSKHFFSPEKIIKIQRSLGSDIMMAFDECTPFPTEFEYVKKSVALTSQWASLCKNSFDNSTHCYNHKQYLFGIIQGSIYEELREESSKDLLQFDFDGYAIGGLAVGEPIETMYKLVNFTTDLIPKNKPRYLMGVGRPENILQAIEYGVDMFDCVMPTRNARNAYLFTSEGIISIKNAKYKNDFEPIDIYCNCYTCANFSRAYLRHLFIAKELLAFELASIHNLHFFMNLVFEARKMILDNKFVEWKEKIINKISLIKNNKEE